MEGREAIGMNKGGRGKREREKDGGRYRGSREGWKREEEESKTRNGRSGGGEAQRGGGCSSTEGVPVSTAKNTRGPKYPKVCTPKTTEGIPALLHMNPRLSQRSYRFLPIREYLARWRY